MRMPIAAHVQNTCFVRVSYAVKLSSERECPKWVTLDIRRCLQSGTSRSDARQMCSLNRRAADRERRVR
jgi:hypothetical protein